MTLNSPEGSRAIERPVPMGRSLFRIGSIERLVLAVAAPQALDGE